MLTIITVHLAQDLPSLKSTIQEQSVSHPDAHSCRSAFPLTTGPGQRVTLRWRRSFLRRAAEPTLFLAVGDLHLFLRRCRGFCITPLHTWRPVVAQGARAALLWSRLATTTRQSMFLLANLLSNISF